LAEAVWEQVDMDEDEKEMLSGEQNSYV